MALKIVAMASSSKSFIVMVLRWRRKRAVMGLRPPPGGPIAPTNWMSTSFMPVFSLRSYQFQWSNHCLSSSMGGCAPYVSQIGMFRSSTNTIWKYQTVFLKYYSLPESWLNAFIFALRAIINYETEGNNVRKYDSFLIIPLDGLFVSGGVFHRWATPSSDGVWFPSSLPHLSDFLHHTPICLISFTTPLSVWFPSPHPYLFDFFHHTPSNSAWIPIFLITLPSDGILFWSSPLSWGVWFLSCKCTPPDFFTHPIINDWHSKVDILDT